MNNIYDILLNFSSNRVYEFYEWDENDKIDHIKKIPIFRVTESQMKNIELNHIKINNDLLTKIHNKTEIYNSNKISYLPYSLIFGNSNECYAFKFDKYGNEIFRSNFILDEKEEILDELKNMKVESIDIDILNTIECYDFSTRYETDSKNLMLNELKKIYEENDFGKLKYIYFELFFDICQDANKIYNELVTKINDEWNGLHQQLLDLFKILNVKKQL